MGKNRPFCGDEDGAGYRYDPRRELAELQSVLNDLLRTKRPNLRAELRPNLTPCAQFETWRDA
jgi:hypothetical protein